MRISDWSSDVCSSDLLTGELRYTRDSRSISARLYDLGTGLPTGGPSRIIDDSINADNLSYNATLSYKLTSNILPYGKVGSGYRAGGFNPRLPEPPAPRPVPGLFGNEQTTSYKNGTTGRQAHPGTTHT